MCQVIAVRSSGHVPSVAASFKYGKNAALLDEAELIPPPCLEMPCGLP
jgi:hypothetical protein